MTHLERNKNYVPLVRHDSGQFWLSRLVLTGQTQNFLGFERHIVIGGLAIAPPDIQSMGAYTDRQDTGLFELSVNLEASNEMLAMTKLAGHALLSMRKAGINLRDIELADGRLGSGDLLMGSGQSELSSIDDIHYALDEDLKGIFTDIHAMTIMYNFPATY